MELSDIIKKYRKANNLSLRDFAKKCDLSYTYILALEKNSDYRTGKEIKPTFKAIENIAKAMDLTTNELLEKMKMTEEYQLLINGDIKYAEILFDEPKYKNLSLSEKIEELEKLEINLENYIKECEGQIQYIENDDLMRVIRKENVTKIKEEQRSTEEQLNGLKMIIGKLKNKNDK